MAGDGNERRDEDDDRTVESDVEALRSGRNEARVVLDHQLQLLSETHTKALRTVRLTGVVFGLILSTATFLEADRFVNWLAIGGVGSLVVAMLSGLVTYSASRPEFGVGEEYLQDVRDESYSESEWLDVLLDGYREWIEYMKYLNDRNSKLLTSTQLLLGLGIVLLTAGAAIAVFRG